MYLNQLVESLAPFDGACVSNIDHLAVLLILLNSDGEREEDLQNARGPNALTFADTSSFVHAKPQTLNARSSAKSRSA